MATLASFVLKGEIILSHMNQQALAEIDGIEGVYAFKGIKSTMIGNNQVIKGFAETKTTIWRFMFFPDNNVGAALTGKGTDSQLLEKAMENWNKAQKQAIGACCC